MASEEASDRPDPDGTETTPLLRGSGAADEYGSSTVGSSNITAVGSGDVTSGNNTVATENGRSGANGTGEQAIDAREGLPGMANKLHFLMPAIGIGVFLSALDQTLIIATYARMSSELEALNRTSWISTA